MQYQKVSFQWVNEFIDRHHWMLLRDVFDEVQSNKPDN